MYEEKIAGGRDLAETQAEELLLRGEGHERSRQHEEEMEADFREHHEEILRWEANRRRYLEAQDEYEGRFHDDFASANANSMRPRDPLLQLDYVSEAPTTAALRAAASLRVARFGWELALGAGLIAIGLNCANSPSVVVEVLPIVLGLALAGALFCRDVPGAALPMKAPLFGIALATGGAVGLTSMKPLITTIAVSTVTVAGILAMLASIVYRNFLAAEED